MKALNVPKLRTYLLCGILVVLPLERLPHLEFHGSTVRISQVLGVFLILAALPLLWRAKTQLVRAPWIFLIGFNLIAFVSALLSAHRGHSLKIAVFVLFVCVLSWTISVVFERERLKLYATCLLIGVAGSCLFGVYQFFGDLAGLPGWATGLRPEYMKGGIFPFPRIESTALEPLYFADYLLVPLGVLVLIQQFRKPRVWPLTLLVLTVISLSLSRGAQVAAAVVVILGLAGGIYKHRYRPVVMIAATGVAAIVISLGLIALGSYLYPQYNGHHNTASASVHDFTTQATNLSQGESAVGRALTRKLALRAAKAHPLIGIGPGNFGFYAHAQEPSQFTTTDTIVNNETLELAAEDGVVGLLLFGLFVASLGLAAFRALRRSPHAALGLALAALLIGLIGVAVQYQLFSTLYITHIWVALGFLAGATAAATATPKARASLRKPRH